MSTTQAGIRRHMLQMEPSLGRVESIASLTTSTVTVSAFAVGTMLSGKFVDRYMLRPTATTSADRLRLISDYNSSTGGMQHRGAAYTDVTATDESVEIHEFEPYLHDNAIQKVMRHSRFLDRYILPLNASGQYWLGDLTWVTGPQNLRIGYTANRVLTNNRGMEKWNAYSSGALVPDACTLAGASGVFARSATARRGAYSLSATRAGTTLTIDEVIPLLSSGVDADSLRGTTVTGVIVGRSAQASSLRVQVLSEDASAVALSTTSSDYHTGGGAWEELTAEHTVDAAAEVLRLRVQVAVDETALIDDRYLMSGTLDDVTRRNVFTTTWFDPTPHFQQGQPLNVSTRAGTTGQLVIESQRPYTEFTQSRVDAGTADADATDIPVALAAHGALWHFYEDHPFPTDETSRKALSYRNSFGQLQMQHLALSSSEDSVRQGVNMTARNTLVSGRIR